MTKLTLASLRQLPFFRPCRRPNRSIRALFKPLGDSWPTYSGDYSGKRYSA